MRQPELRRTALGRGGLRPLPCTAALVLTAIGATTGCRGGRSEEIPRASVPSVAGDAGPAGDGAELGTAGGGAPEPYASLAIEPVDGTTAQNGSDLQLRLYQASGVVDEAKLQALAAAALLESWPERVPVAFAIDRLAEPPLVGSQILRVVPQTPLEDRWYVVGVRSPLPAAIRYGMALPDGTMGSRFRPGSHPRVAQIQFCEKAAAGMKLLVLFSEPVMFTRSADEIVSLQIAGSPSPCVSYWTMPAGLYFTCASLTPNDQVVVSVGAGIQSASGGAVEAASWSVEIGALPATSCRSFTPTL
jgi:hypothetical protein